MAGLSLCHDGPVLESLLGICELPAFGPTLPECTDTEAEHQNQFDRIVNYNSAVNPSQGMVQGDLEFKLPSGSSPDSVHFDYSDVPSCWIQKFYRGGGAEDSSYEKVEGVVYKILNEKVATLQDGDASYLNWLQLTNASAVRRQCESLTDMLMWIKGVATDPCDLTASGTLQGWRKQRKLILRTRKAMFRRITNNLSKEEFPYRKKQKLHQFLCETSDNGNFSSEKLLVGLRGGRYSFACSVPSMLNQNNSVSSSKSTHEMLNQPKRRSQRSLGLLKFNENHLPRKRIPIGPFFQADVPDWTGPSNDRLVSGDNENLNDLRWLGTRIWPVEGDSQETNVDIIGKGRPNLCFCTFPGSVSCIRLHVSMARLQMKSDLGEFFSSLGFHGMGEEVSKSWTFEEQMNFDMLVRLNPISEYKSFWEPASKCFASKSSQDLASYYFNVFVLGRMSIQTRLASGEVDSDDDESYVNALQPLYSSCSQRRYSKRKS